VPTLAVEQATPAQAVSGVALDAPSWDNDPALSHEISFLHFLFKLYGFLNKSQVLEFG
jgi:hypothetical protein